MVQVSSVGDKWLVF